MFPELEWVVELAEKVTVLRRSPRPNHVCIHVTALRRAEVGIRVACVGLAVLLGDLDSSSDISLHLLSLEVLHVDGYALIGLKNVEELHHVRFPHEVLKNFGLSADDINGFGMQRLLVYNFQGRCFWVDNLTWLEIKFVLHDDDDSVGALS